MIRRPPRGWWNAVRRRRLARAALSLALALGVVVASAERGAGALGPWSGFVGMIALCVLVAALVQGSTRALGVAVGILGAAAALAGNGRLSGTHGAVEDAVLAACLLLVMEAGCWSAELRSPATGGRAPRGVDLRRLAYVGGAAIGGGALGGLSVAIAAATRGVLVGIVPVAAAAAAGCLLLLLALTLASPDR